MGTNYDANRYFETAAEYESKHSQPYHGQNKPKIKTKPALEKILDVDGYYFEVALSKKDNTPMVKVVFYDEESMPLHSSYLCLEHDGYAYEKAVKMLVMFFKDVDDYIGIVESMGKPSVETIVKLQNDIEGRNFFKKVKRIRLSKQSEEDQFYNMTERDVEFYD